MSPLAPADTRRFVAAFYQAIGDLHPVTAMQAFMTRQALDGHSTTRIAAAAARSLGPPSASR